MREGGREGGWRWHYKEMLIPTKGNQSPNDSTGRKGEQVSGREMKWKTATNWKSSTGVEGGDVEAVQQGDSSLKGWR